MYITVNKINVIKTFFCFRWMPELNDMLSMMKNTIDNRLKPKSRASSVTGRYLINAICQGR